MPAEPRAFHITVRGTVQGVGFRPFVYRLANELGLAGWVQNRSGDVTIHIEGEDGAVDRFQEVGGSFLRDVEGWFGGNAKVLLGQLYFVRTER